MIVGCYTLDLYCDAEGCTNPRPHTSDGGRGPLAQYTAETGGACRRDARRDGWRLRVREGRAICPQCPAPRGTRSLASRAPR